MKENSEIVKQAEIILLEYRKGQKNKTIYRILGNYAPYLLIALSIIFLVLSVYFIALGILS